MKRPEFIKKSLFGIFSAITIPSFATSKEKISERIVTLKNNIGLGTEIDEKIASKYIQLFEE